MRIGTYIFSGLVLITLVAGGVYLINPGYYSVTLLGITVNLPVAAWFALAMGLLFLATLLHMVYHGTRSYFKRRRYLDDIEELKDSLYWSLLQEPKEHRYRIPQMREGAPLLNVARLQTVGSVSGLSEKLTKALEWVKRIENGEVVDLKEKKIERFLSKENPLLVRNQLNRLQKEKGFAEKVLQARESYDEKVVQEALEILVAREDLSKLKKYIPFLERKHLYRLLERADRKEEIGLTPDVLEALAEALEPECGDYLRIAQTTVRRFTPDENLALFKRLSRKDEKAQNAYLYLLFEYEMVDEANRFLEEHDEREFLPFRAFAILKNEKHPFKIDDLLDTEIACR